MPEKANQSSRISWSHTAVRSQTIEEYKKDHGGKRPKFEASTTGKHLRILTGANVTRKREWTWKGVALGFWGGLKIIYQKVTIDPAGEERLRRNAVLTAGQKFDGGINKLVEDMVKGEDLSEKSWRRMRFDKRAEALYEQAKILKAKGGFSDNDIAERFRINLMESLRVAQKEVKPKDYKKVLNQIRNDILPKFETLVKKADSDSDEFRKEQTFKRSVVVAALRDVETFGCDKKKFDAFGGSHVLHDLYRGNTDLLDVSKGDVLAVSGFKGDAGAYEFWGGCAPLYEKFGDDPEVFRGKMGAKILSEWLDDTYGKGSGAAFLNAHPRRKNGVGNNRGLRALGRTVQEEIGDYQGLGYNKLDLKKVDKVVNGPDTPLKAAFEDHLKTAKSGLAAGKWPTLECLRELETLRGNPDDYDRDTLQQKIKDFAQKTMMPGCKIFVPPDAKAQFQKQIAEQWGYDSQNVEPSMADSLKHLDSLDINALKEVVSKGLAKVDKALRNTIRDVLVDYGKRGVKERKTRLHNRHIGQLIDNAYGGDRNPGIGDKMVKQRLEDKQNENLDNERDKSAIDGHDLRIIEKELYKQGYVRKDSKQAPKAQGNDIKSDLDNVSKQNIDQRHSDKPDPKLQISEPPQQPKHDSKIEVDLLDDNKIDVNPTDDTKTDVKTEKQQEANPAVYGITLDGKKHWHKPDKKKLAQDLEAAGNNNVEASKQNRGQGDICSADFAKDIENGIVRIRLSYGNKYQDREDKISVPTDLTQSKSKMRPQDAAFLTGAFSSASIGSRIFSGDVTFLKDKRNAFNHPDNAKLPDPDYSADGHIANSIRIKVEMDDNGAPTGRYSVNIALRAKFDQIKFYDGNSIGTKDSEVELTGTCEVDCTQANAKSGGSINVVNCICSEQGVRSSSQ